MGSAYAKTIRVAVIDTGLDLSDPRFSALLCKDIKGVNLVPKEGIRDLIGHGTHVAGIIKKYAKDANYCMMIIKYYSIDNSNTTNMINSILAMKFAVENKATVIV